MQRMKKCIAIILCMILTISAAVSPISFSGMKASVLEADAASKVWNGKASTSWYTGDMDYYEISTAEQLAGLAKLVNAGNDMNGITIKLTDDIVLNNTKKFSKWNKKKPKNIWKMIGDSDHPFSGVFDGNGHSITGMYCNNRGRFHNLFNSWTYGAGLFGYINCATIMNVSVKKSYICGWNNIGVIAASSENSIIVSVYVDNAKVYFGENGAGAVIGRTSNAVGYKNLYYSWATMIMMSVVAGGMVNPVIFGFGDSLYNKSTGELKGSIIYNSKVNNVSFFKDKKATAGPVALFAGGGVTSDCGLGIKNCLATNCKISSNGTKGVATTFKVKGNKNVFIQNNYYYNLKLKKKCKKKKMVDKASVKKVKKSTVYSEGFVKKLGGGFTYKKGSLPVVLGYRAPVDTKAINDKYKVLEDGYYVISGMQVDPASKELVSGDTDNVYYLQYQPMGFYSITASNGNAVEMTDNCFVAKNPFNEHKFSQRWILRPRDGKYEIAARGEKTVIGRRHWIEVVFNASRDICKEVDGVDNTTWSITPYEPNQEQTTEATTEQSTEQSTQQNPAS